MDPLTPYSYGEDDWTSFLSLSPVPCSNDSSSSSSSSTSSVPSPPKDSFTCTCHTFVAQEAVYALQVIDPVVKKKFSLIRFQAHPEFLELTYTRTTKGFGPTCMMGTPQKGYAILKDVSSLSKIRYALCSPLHALLATQQDSPLFIYLHHDKQWYGPYTYFHNPVDRHRTPLYADSTLKKRKANSIYTVPLPPVPIVPIETQDLDVLTLPLPPQPSQVLPLSEAKDRAEFDNDVFFLHNKVLSSASSVLYMRRDALKKKPLNPVTMRLLLYYDSLIERFEDMFDFCKQFRTSVHSTEMLGPFPQVQSSQTCPQVQSHSCPHLALQY